MAALHRLAQCVGTMRSGRQSLCTTTAASAAVFSHGDGDGWEVCVGLELHAQVKAVTKAFSPAAVVFAQSPNSHVDPHDAGMPGTLPVLNRRMVVSDSPWFSGSSSQTYCYSTHCVL
jgi:hypothetical protein